MLHREATAEALGLGRICLYLVWLALVIVTPMHWYAEAPYELFEPWGLLRLLPDAAYQAAFTPAFLVGFKSILIFILALLVLGVRPFTPLAVLAFIMLLFHDGVMKGWQSSVNHAQAPALYAALILACFPAADGLSVLGRRRTAGMPVPEPRVYGCGLWAVAAMLCFTYAFVGVRRVAFGGVEVFAGDSLITALALRSLEYGPFGFDYGVLVLTAGPWLVVAMKTGYFITTLFEVLSPLALLSRWFRYAWLAVIVPFHFATLFTMNIFFWENLLLILVFVTGLAHALFPAARQAEPTAAVLEEGRA